ncbi:hypothetical protein FQN57_001354 [Myotisia sp. PD_48]|nr:hypothetical protein FQN57_001354 [Myotisia sp. PD_48]
MGDEDEITLGGTISYPQSQFDRGELGIPSDTQFHGISPLGSFGRNQSTENTRSELVFSPGPSEVGSTLPSVITPFTTPITGWPVLFPDPASQFRFDGTYVESQSPPYTNIPSNTAPLTVNRITPDAEIVLRSLRPYLEGLAPEKLFHVSCLLDIPAESIDQWYRNPQNYLPMHTPGRFADSDPIQCPGQNNCRLAGEFRCPTCLGRFGTKPDVKRHLFTSNPPIWYYCPICHQRFPRKDKFAGHITRYHPGSHEDGEIQSSPQNRNALAERCGEKNGIFRFPNPCACGDWFDHFNEWFNHAVDPSNPGYCRNSAHAALLDSQARDQHVYPPDTLRLERPNQRAHQSRRRSLRNSAESLARLVTDRFRR